MNNPAKKIEAYQKTGTYASTVFADPHSLITQMLDGALTRIAQAKGAIERKEIATKAELISKAITIIGSLEGCLDHEKGGELSRNLSSLYEYMNFTLAEGNIYNNVSKLEEVTRLLLEIKVGWMQIPQQLKAAQG
jgi:flagellar protein FliS